MRFMILQFILVSVASGNVIPSNHLDNNITENNMFKRVEYQNIWINNKAPLEICPAVQASLTPSINSRMCEAMVDEDKIDPYFVTLEDIQNRASWVKERENHKGNFIKTRHLDSGNGDSKDNEKNTNVLVPIIKDSAWAYEKPGIGKNNDKYIVGYFNTDNVGDMIQEPTDEDLQVFISLDDLRNMNIPVHAFQKPQQSEPVVIETVLPSSFVDNVPEGEIKVQVPNEHKGDYIELNEKGITGNLNDTMVVTETPSLTETSQQDGVTEMTTGIPANTIDLAEQVQSEKKQTKASVEDLEKTNELMAEILEKLKQVEDFEQIGKSVQKFVDNIKNDFSLESRSSKESGRN